MLLLIVKYIFLSIVIIINVIIDSILLQQPLTEVLDDDDVANVGTNVGTV